MSQTLGTILVVDDEPGMRDMLAFELSQDGFVVETAESGMAAMSAAKRRKFDVAITDLKMPGMDGGETLEALRLIDPDIEVIVATGYATVDTAVACMKRGAYDYIEKPYDLEELKHLLARAIEKSRLQGVVALYEASRSLLGTLQQDSLTTLVLSLAKRVLTTESAGLRRLGVDGAGALKTSAASKQAEALLQRLADQALVSDSPLLFPEPRENPPAWFDTEVAGSALIVPLISRGRLLAHLCLLRPSGWQAFSSSDLQRAVIFASQVALAIDNASAYEQLAEKVNELTKTREQLIHAEKLALAAHLAGGVAHEVNNPLAVIRIGLDTVNEYADVAAGLWQAAKSAALQLRHEGSPESIRLAKGLLSANGKSGAVDGVISSVGDVIDEALDAVKRIADLLTGFQGLVQPAPTSQAQRVSLKEAALESARDVEGPRGTRPEITVDAEGGGQAEAWATEDDVKSALRNIFKFLAHEPAREQTREPIRVQLQSDGGGAGIAITDPALQLDDEECLRIWDPRLHLDYEKGRTMRLDLTLSLAYQLIIRNQGTLEVERPEGGGTVFRLGLPPVKVRQDG